MTVDDELKPPVGFIGLGEIGGQMARTLIKGGYQLRVTDLRREAVEAVVTAGGTAAVDAAELARTCTIVLCSLPSSQTFVEVAQAELLPAARPGQVVIDLGTTTPVETRRLATQFAKAGATLLDVPVSGGAAGAQASSLLLFGGGDPAALETLQPLLTRLGRLTVCGPSGAGQIVKGVNQLMMGLGWAAYTEALAYGVRAGVDPGVIAEALGHDGQWRRDFNTVANLAAEGKGDTIGVKFRELPYFLREAQENGFPLPLTSALYAFCAAGARVAFDDHRSAPSFWWQLVGEAAEASDTSGNSPTRKDPSDDANLPHET